MTMRDLENVRPPDPRGTFHVVYVAPGGVAVLPFADRYLAVRVVLGHVYDPHDGLAAEVDEGREPVPWESAAVRDEALAALLDRAERAEDAECSDLLRLAEHVRRTPYYEDA
ncbi:MAG: hypothetical protein AAF563_04715 [Pseudomonadota bacterium]